jgi:DNA-binding XRE family transcriptional regulator
MCDPKVNDLLQTVVALVLELHQSQEALQLCFDQAKAFLKDFQAIFFAQLVLVDWA